MKSLGLFLSLLIFASCSVSVRVPGNRFHTPETVAEHKGTIGVGRAGMGKVELTDDFESHFIEDRDFNLSYSSSLHGSIAYGIINRVEVGAFYNYDSSTSLYGKVNILRSKMGSSEFLLSGVMSIGISSDTKEATVSSTKSSVDVNFTTTDTGLLAGIAFTDRFMIYTGAYYLSMSYDGTHKVRDVSRDVEGSIISPTAVYGFQWKLSPSVALIAEGAYSKLGATTKEDDYSANQFKRDIHSWGVKMAIY